MTFIQQLVSFINALETIPLTNSQIFFKIESKYEIQKLDPLKKKRESVCRPYQQFPHRIVIVTLNSRKPEQLYLK